MATFQLFDGDGNALENAVVEADSARDACRIFYERLACVNMLWDLQAVNVEVPDDSPLRSGKLWHGLPEHMPKDRRLTIDTVDHDEGCCMKYCPTCYHRINRWFVGHPMLVPERCPDCKRRKAKRLQVPAKRKKKKT